MDLVRLLLISFGIVYLWFGSLKFFPGISPAEVLSGETIHLLTFGLIPNMVAVKMLAVLEVAIGLACIIGIRPGLTIRVIVFHMVCTFTPFLLLPDQVFNGGFFTLTLVGQYIVKNIVFVCALLIAYKVVSTKMEVSTTEGPIENTGRSVRSTLSAGSKKPSDRKEPEIVFKTSLGGN